VNESVGFRVLEFRNESDSENAVNESDRRDDRFLLCDSFTGMPVTDFDIESDYWSNQLFFLFKTSVVSRCGLRAPI
jgi:hypothetical protein